MARYRMVISSDWHLDARTGGVERRHWIEEAVMAGPVRAAIRGEADLFAFLGDLCDPGQRLSVHDAAFPLRVAHTLTDHKIKSVWLTGNHDVVLTDRIRTTLDPLKEAALGDVFVCDQPAVSRREHVTLLAFPYVAPAARARLDAEPAAIELGGLEGLIEKAFSHGKPVIALGHCTAFPGAVEGSEVAEYARGAQQPWPDGVAKRAVFSSNGHLHEPQIIKLQDGGMVHVPGSLVRLTFADSERTRGFLQVDLEV